MEFEFEVKEGKGTMKEKALLLQLHFRASSRAYPCDWRRRSVRHVSPFSISDKAVACWLNTSCAFFFHRAFSFFNFNSNSIWPPTAPLQQKKGHADGLTQPLLVSQSGNQEPNALPLYNRRTFRSGFNCVKTFEFYRLRSSFQALGTLHFPAGESGNVVRGAFGLLLRQTASSDVYARLFEPGRAQRPFAERLKDWPRRLSSARPRWTAGRSRLATLSTSTCRCSIAAELMGAILATFEQLGETGLGPGRGRAALTRVEQIGVDESACEMALRPARHQ